MALWTFKSRDLDPLLEEPVTINKVVLIEPSGVVAWEYLKSIPVLGAEGYDSSPANASPGHPSLSNTGLVAYAASANNLAPGDTNGKFDIFGHDLETTNPAVIAVSLGLGGAPVNGPSGYAAVSGAGRYIAFQSEADNLVPGDSNGVSDVFGLDRPAS
jgi:hypothetical protein